MRPRAVVASWVVPASNRVAGRRGVCEPAQRVGLCGSSTTILPCRLGRGSGRHRPTSWGPTCRLLAKQFSFGWLGADSLGRGPCDILGLAGCREAPSQMSLQTLPSVGNLVAVKLAGHLGVTGSPVEACWELAEEAHRERRAAGDRRARCGQRAARRSRPSIRHLLKDTSIDVTAPAFYRPRNHPIESPEEP
jgi:hypothetical protein